MWGMPSQTAATPPEPEPEPPRPPDEYEKLLAFEEQMFAALGFNEWQAIALAEAGVSWHDAKPLIERGCKHETAVDLLL